jgi:cation:H+ antiporter
MGNPIFFVLWLGLVLGSSTILERQLESIGARLRFTEALQGFAPDSPPAWGALHSGHDDLGNGVVLGSNLFNLAALLGLSVLVAGEIRIPRKEFALSAVVALVVTAVGTATVMRWVAPGVAVAALVVVLLPYAIIAGLKPETIARLPATSLLRRVAARSGGAESDDARVTADTDRRPLVVDLLLIVPLLAAIVGGSIGMVGEAVPLAARVGIPSRLVGPVILAGLTGIPNVVAALRLATKGRGSALVSEALNSNTINVAVGICLTAVLLGVRKASADTVLTVWWLAGATVATLALIASARKLGRLHGGLIVSFYLGFVAVLIFR